MTDMTLYSLAGFCNESVLWKLLADLSSALLDKPVQDREVLIPEKVIIDGDNFMLSQGKSLDPAPEFCPPEGIENYGDEGVVWSLGALVCFASSGHYVFGGRGGVYQRSNPNVELPTLRKEHSALTPIVKRCLCYAAPQRISLTQLHSAAVKGFEVKEQKARVIRKKESSEDFVLSEIMDDVWPEKMD